MARKTKRSAKAVLALAVSLATGLYAGCTGTITEPGARDGEVGPGGTPASKDQDAVAPAARVSRLTHQQWQNSVRDLFGIPASTPIEAELPQDPKTAGYLFDNDAQSLSVDQALWGAYQRGADAVVELVVGDAALFAKLLPPDTGDPDQRARTLIDELGSRAYRRPLAQAEKDELFEVYQGAAALFSGVPALEAGVRLVLQALLQSPFFLYRIESSTKVVNGVVPLDGYEMASRLSYTLLDTMPDAKLFAAAAAGELSSVANVEAGDSEAAGESIDHRIGRELNPGGRDSLFLYSGKSGGWLGGPCISYRGPAQRRSALHNPWTAYQTIVGGDTSLSPEARAEIVGRQKSVNDLVRGQLQSLMARPELSSNDKQRLQLHFDSVRDLEVALTCRLTKDKELLLQGESAGYDSADGNEVLSTARLHIDIAALALACGYTRSVALQIGSGNDGSTRYPDPDSGGLMADNFHYISHRRKSHDSSGTIIDGSDLLHSKVDRHFAQLFKYLLDRLSAYDMPSGKPLLHHGVAVWYNDN